MDRIITPVVCAPTSAYTPKLLRFGTSGRRGEVVDLTQLEIYINVLAELQCLQSLPPNKGGIVPGDLFYYARDLRPSSNQFVLEEQGRGEIAQVTEQAIRDSGMIPVNLGCIPTPALTFHALLQGKGSIMITGSHIPFDRNGYKTNTSVGELLKEHESLINQCVEDVRQRVYQQDYGDSLFNEQGMFKGGHRELLPERDEALHTYIQRYTDFFAAKSLRGRRILLYQHSAVGRDLLAEVLGHFGAEVIPEGRSKTFVPIDTENIDDNTLTTIQNMVDTAVKSHGALDAVVSTDGDSDRPLVLGLESEVGDPKKQKVRFLGGDLLGMVVAEFLDADAVVVPISCNDAVDRGSLQDRLEPKTRIGSPYVIAGMQRAREKGRTRVCGWEANGGFLIGSDIARGGKLLRALPTRDAFLPILAVLFAMSEQQIPMVRLFQRLPKRYGRAALLRRFPRTVGLKIIERFSPTDPRIVEAKFEDGTVRGLDDGLSPIEIDHAEAVRVSGIRRALKRVFSSADGFGGIVRLNWIDGLRMTFSNGDVAHVRPSGNADELRIYAVADTQDRADCIARLGVAEPDGLLRRLELNGDPPAAKAAKMHCPGVLVLEGAVQHYKWGGYEFIPALLGIENREKKPYAEFWIGVHPKAPSLVVEGSRRTSLTELIAQDPISMLGEATASRFKGQLPYLFKALDARQMLSIQAHPNKQQAEDGFARENTAGVPLDATTRNYKDDNHKPEAHIALTDFWMLHGFRPLEEITEILESVHEFHTISPTFRANPLVADGRAETPSEWLKRLYSEVMEMPQERVDSILRPLVARLDRMGIPDKSSPDFWALRAAREFPLPGGHLDRGIFSIYWLNLIRLKPGEGTYQPAGLLHAYLEGTNMEVMANSDNVLRGGLTLKHVDTPELLRTLNFQGGKPEILTGEQVSPNERVYRTPCREFEVSTLRLGSGQWYQCAPIHSADTLMVLEGSIRIVAYDQILDFSRGKVFLVPSAISYRIEPTTPTAVLYKTSVPA